MSVPCAPSFVPPAAPERRPRQRYEDWGDRVPMFLLHSVSPSHPKPGLKTFKLARFGGRLFCGGVFLGFSKKLVASEKEV